MNSQKVTEALYYRIYPTYLQGTRDQLKKVNTHSFYRISVWQGDNKLGEMIEGASPAILIDKIYLTKASINFSQEIEGGDITFKLHQHDQQDRELGSGIFSLDAIKHKYIEQTQKYHSQQQATLQTITGPLKLVFAIFIEIGRYELEQYVRRHRENQKHVMRARRNINQYKRDVLNKTSEREKSASRSKRRSPQRKLSDIKETKNESGIEREEAENQKEGNTIESLVQNPLIRLDSWGNTNTSYLQIDSAAKFHTKSFNTTAPLPLFRKITDPEEKQSLPSSTVIGQSTFATRFLVSALDVATPSLISDGSEESQMRMNKQQQTYSEKALKKFRMNLNIFTNIIMTLLAIFLIYVMIAPSSKFPKIAKIKPFEQ